MKGTKETLKPNGIQIMAVNALKLDPSKTTGLRRSFSAEMEKRFNLLRRALFFWLVHQDGLELKPRTTPFREAIVTNYAFTTDEARSAAFIKWFSSQVEASILSVNSTGAKWTEKYVGAAYKKGIVRTYNSIHRKELLKGGDWYEGGKSQFLKSSFGESEMASKIKLLATRNFEQLKDVTSTMSSQLNMILGDGMANGRGPREIARDMAKRIDGMSKKRALTIARTEIIYAHAEGQLDSMANLGISKVQAVVEFDTAGDDRVCERCASLQGKTFTLKEAHGIIPVHPNCRCAWIPIQESPSKEEVKNADKVLADFFA